jgi:plasmid stabilization system protein ParE
MRVIYKKSFQNRLLNYLEFIASDNLTAAKRIKSEILEKIQSIPSNPYLYRKSIYFDDQTIRDCVIRTCTIVYKIEQEKIIVFGFLKHHQFPTDDDERYEKT